MTLVVIEPCEDFHGKPHWTKAPSLTGPAGGGRDGTNCFVLTGGLGFTTWMTWSLTTYSDQHTTATMGMAIKPNNPSGSGAITYNILTISEFLLQMFRESTDISGYRLRVLKGSDNVGQTSQVLLDESGYQYVEIQVNQINPGSVKVKVNEVTKIDVSGLSTGGNQVNSVTIGNTQNGTSNGTPISFDDIYVTNGLGTDNNSFLGDVSCRRLFPNAAGDVSLLVPNPATNPNWENVNDWNGGTSDFNEGNLVNLYDLYHCADLPSSLSGNQVFGIDVWVNVNTAFTPREAAFMLKTGGTEYTSASFAVPTSHVTRRMRREKNPVTNAPWTTSEINSLQIGAKITL